VKEDVMPKVGKKDYAYTAKGLKQAKAAAARTGKPVRRKGKK
jgi:hypothetical protein